MFNAGGAGWFLVGDLRSHMPCGMANVGHFTVKFNLILLGEETTLVY